MIKSVIILACIGIMGYSYVTNTSVKTIIKQNDIKFQSPIAMKRT